MPSFRLIAAAAIAALAAWTASTATYARSLKIGGTGAATELLRQIAPSFKDTTGIELEVVAGLGTSGAISAAIDGKIGLAVAGRDLRDAEAAQGLRILGTLQTPFGLVTSRPGPDGIKRDAVAALFGADKPTWPDGSPVILILRPAGESDNMVMAGLFPGLGDVLPVLRKRRDLSVAATDQDNADAAERFKGSLVGASLVQIMAEKRNLRFLAIDGVMPSLEAFENGTYPLSRTLHLAAPAAASSEAVAFIEFLGKAQGAALLRRFAVIAK